MFVDRLAVPYAQTVVKPQDKKLLLGTHWVRGFGAS